MKEIHFKKIQWKKPDLKGKWQKLKNMKPGDIKAHLKKQHERRQQILVIGVLTQPDLYEKTVSNMVECKSRGAYLMGLTTFGNYNIEDTADFTVYIPKTDPHFATSLAVIPLQLLGYYVSVAKGLDVDKPRNLAKSVTVE